MPSGKNHVSYSARLPSRIKRRIFCGVLLALAVWLEGIFLHILPYPLDCHISFEVNGHSIFDSPFPAFCIILFPVCVLINHQLLKRVAKTSLSIPQWLLTAFLAFSMPLIAATLTYGGSPIAPTRTNPFPISNPHTDRMYKWEGYSWKWLGVEEWHQLPATPTAPYDCN